MRCPKRNSQRSRYGGVLITTLAFAVVIAMLLAGIATLTVSHYGRVNVEADYSGALNLAEAGVNYELRKISANAAQADQASNVVQAGDAGLGVQYTLGSGTFRVYCANLDGTTPWVAPNPLLVISSGTLNGATRTVRITAKGYPWTGKFAIYSVDHISVWHGSAVDITGDVGSDNVLDFSGTPGITGSVYFDGPNAGWFGGVNPGAYSVVRNAQPILWPTVDEIALKKFPAASFAPGGLPYIATHNNNASANPPIVGNSITDNVTLTGPGDYYVTNIDLHGQKKITFDNTNGPVNIWVGPAGGNGTCTFRGGTGAISAITDPTKVCNIYVATQSGIDMAGNQTVDAVVYAYNKDNAGTEYGYVQNSGNPTINGQILSNQVNLNGNITVNYVQGANKTSNFPYYGFDNQWSELNGR